MKNHNHEFFLQKESQPQHINQKPVVYFPSLSFEKSISTVDELEVIETKPKEEMRDEEEIYNNKTLESVHTSLLRGEDNTSIEPDKVFVSKTLKEKVSLMSHAAGPVCFILLATNPLLPSYHPISCDLKVFRTVLCEMQNRPMEAEMTTLQESSFSVSASDNTVFRCASGTFVSKLYTCEIFSSCGDTEIEGGICNCYHKNHLVKNSTFCNRLCYPSECKCPQLLRQRKHGGCEIYQPENLYQIVVSPDHGPNQFFKCLDGPSVQVTFFNDLVPDCTLGEDEPLLCLNATNMENLRYTCPKADMYECHPGSIHCYSEMDICQYKIDEQKKTLIPCRNGKHLDDCKQVDCGHKFKCKSSYCVPHSCLCNGRWDCWNGDDENHCKSRLCVGFFKCRHSSMCIHLDDLCDNILDCPLRDDEQLCDVKHCFLHCNCLGFAVECSNISAAQYLPMHHFNDFLFVSISFANVIDNLLQWSLDQAAIFVFINNGLLDFHRFIFNCHFVFLHFLDLSRNLLSKLPTSATAYKTRHKHLSVMILSSNRIQTIEPHAFENFCYLVYLDLSKNHISNLQIHIFASNLRGLNLSGNEILTASRTTFLHTNLQFLSTDQYQICCLLLGNPAVLCTNMPLDLSTCDRLFTSIFLGVIVWSSGAAVLMFNLLSFASNIFEMKHFGSKKKKTLTIHSFKTCVLCTNLSDILFGMYLVSISLKDTISGENFIEEEKTWRMSVVCYFLGGMHLLSLLLSLFFLLTIDILRFMAIACPLETVSHKTMISKTLFLSSTVSFCLTCMSILLNSHLQKERVLATPLCTLFGYFQESIIQKITNGVIAVFLLGTMLVILVLLIMLVNAAKASAQSAGRKSNLPNQGLSQFVALMCFCHVLCWLPSSIFFFLSGFKIKSHLVIHNLVQTVILGINPLMNPVLFNLSQIKKTISQAYLCSRKKEAVLS